MTAFTIVHLMIGELQLGYCKSLPSVASRIDIGEQVRLLRLAEIASVCYLGSQQVPATYSCHFIGGTSNVASVFITGD